MKRKKIFIYNPFSDTRIGFFSPSVCNSSVMLSSPVSMVPLTSGLSYNRKKKQKKKKKNHTRCIFFPFTPALAQISKIDYNNKLRSKTWDVKEKQQLALNFKTLRGLKM